MTNPDKGLPNLDPEKDLDPLTESRTVAQTPTQDEQITELPEVGEARTGDFDATTGAAHPAEGSGSDKGVGRE